MFPGGDMSPKLKTGAIRQLQWFDNESAGVRFAAGDRANRSYVRSLSRTFLECLQFVCAHEFFSVDGKLHRAATIHR